MKDLYQTCLDFRNAIIKTPKSRLSIGFQDFPYGSCGDTSLILGAFLQESDFGVFDYVCGDRNGSSHASLEKSEIIVDITAGQFEDCDKDVYVGERAPFYKSFDEDFRHIYFESLDGKPIRMDRLWKGYEKICQFL